MIVALGILIANPSCVAEHREASARLWSKTGLDGLEQNREHFFLWVIYKILTYIHMSVFDTQNENLEMENSTVSSEMSDNSSECSNKTTSSNTSTRVVRKRIPKTKAEDVEGESCCCSCCKNFKAVAEFQKMRQFKSCDACRANQNQRNRKKRGTNTRNTEDEYEDDQVETPEAMAMNARLTHERLQQLYAFLAKKYAISETLADFCEILSE